MNISIGSVAGKDMQFIRNDLTMRVFSTPYIMGETETTLATSNDNKIAAGSVFIDGYKDNATINITDGMSAQAFGINVHAAGLGIEAYAVTKGQLFGMKDLSLIHI